MKILKFVPMAKELRAKKKGGAKLDKFTISKKESSHHEFQCMMAHDSGNHCYPGTYARLCINDSVVMSDTQMEQRTNLEFLYSANGHVLIAGLGIGMIVLPLMRAGKKIKTITVIEKSQDVIDIIGPQLKSKRGASKLTIVQGDIFEWRPAVGTKYDTIYFDIWQDRCTENLKEMYLLERKFRKYLNKDNPERWSNSWCKDELQVKQRQEKASSWY